MSNRREESYRKKFIGEIVADLAFVVVFAVTTSVLLIGPVTLHPLVRYAVAAPLFVFLPGYAIVVALFPQNRESVTQTETALGPLHRSITPLERVAFSIGVTITVVPIAGLVLNVVLGGLTLPAIMLMVTGLTLVATLAAGGRRFDLPAEKRFRVPYRRWVSGVINPNGRSELVANVFLVVSIAVLVATFGYTTTVPSASFTEFGVLATDSSGELTAEEYPSELTRSESAEFNIEVTNREGHDQRYTVVAQFQRVGPQQREVLSIQKLDRFQFEIESGETRRRAHSFTPRITGDDLRVTYLLYRGDPPPNPQADTAYRRTHIWIDVSE